MPASAPFSKPLSLSDSINSPDRNAFLTTIPPPPPQRPQTLHQSADQQHHRSLQLMPLPLPPLTQTLPLPSLTQPLDVDNDNQTYDPSHDAQRDRETSVRFDHSQSQDRDQGQGQSQGQEQEDDKHEEDNGETAEGGQHVGFSRNFMLKKGHGMDRISFKVMAPLEG